MLSFFLFSNPGTNVTIAAHKSCAEVSSSISKSVLATNRALRAFQRCFSIEDALTYEQVLELKPDTPIWYGLYTNDVQASTHGYIFYDAAVELFIGTEDKSLRVVDTPPCSDSAVTRTDLSRVMIESSAAVVICR